MAERCFGVKPNATALTHFTLDSYPITKACLRYGTFAVVGLVAIGAIALISVTAVFESGTYGALPSDSELRNIINNEASRVVSRDGAQLGKYFIDERVEVSREDIPTVLVEALVATEDARFYDHNGIDVMSWGRVAYRTVLGGDASGGGGSTISQQLVKNLFPRIERHEDPTYSLVINKIREVLIARDIERLHDKDAILTMYLNTVPFPDNTYGVGVAAKRYFSKTPNELNVEEAATLVGSLKATYSYDPLRHPVNALRRRNLVLRLMADHGYLTPLEMIDAQERPIQVCYQRDEHNVGPATHFRENARLELKSILAGLEHPEGRAYDIYRDGLNIYTTIDAGMQQHAETAVKTHLVELQEQFYASLEEGEKPWEVEVVYTRALRQSERVRGLRRAGFSESAIDSIMAIPVTMTIYDYATAGEKTVEMSPADSVAYYLGILNSGFLAVEPGTGAIRAWVGGTNHAYFKYDKVRSRRSVGSTFKPILYAAALQQGIDPCQYWGNYRRTYARYEYWRPRNSENNYGGSYNMRGALTKSLNTISAQLIMKARPQNVVDLAHRMGIEHEIPTVPAIALGAGDLSLHDMVQAYSVFANRGQKVKLRYIDRITDRDGEVIYSYQIPQPTEENQVLSQDHADLMRGMLESVVDDGTGRRLRWRYKLEGRIAGKTGTSQNHSDGWFIGFTPKLLAGVWTGAESPAVRFRSIKYGQGANMALPIFGDFMQKLNEDARYSDYLAGEFATPSELVQEQLACPTRPVYRAPRSTPAEATPTPVPMIAGQVIEQSKPAADRAVAPE